MTEVGIVNTGSTASRTAGQCIRHGELGKMGQRVDGRCVLSGCASGKAIFHLPRSSYQTNLGRRWSESHQESLRASCQEESGAALIARLRRCLGAGVYAGLKLVAYGSSIACRSPPTETSQRSKLGWRTGEANAA